MAAYPVTFDADYVEPRNRLTTGFRLILAIPHLIFAALWGIAAGFAILFAWFAIVFTGRYPDGLYNFVSQFTRFITRVSGYVLLMTDEYPPFDGEKSDAYPVRMDFAGPLPEYSRWKTGLRIILGLPILVLRYALGFLLEIAAFGAWVVIVITGKQPRGLQDLLELVLAYTARSDAYLFLLTETYPPFQVDRARLEAPPATPAVPAPERPAQIAEPQPPQPPQP